MCDCELLVIVAASGHVATTSGQIPVNVKPDHV